MDYVSPGDCHVYSIDECFFDLTGYLPYYKVSAHELMLRMIRSVLRETGITATAGIGPKPYLAKVCMDIGFDSVGMEEANYRGRTYVNHQGKVAPYPVHGSEKLLIYTDSVSMITEAALGIFRRIMPPKLYARQIRVVLVIASILS